MDGKMNKLVILLVGLLFVLIGLAKVNGSGECGKNTTPDQEAFKLAPCAGAVEDVTAPVSSDCCVMAKKMGSNPRCMCAVLMSDIAKMSGVKPEIALTIPKRCNIADRPVGYKCGPYTLP